MNFYSLALLLVVSFGASWLTFYSGFGLGTLLLPVLVLYFPVDQAILMTALVHFLNNIFKLSLVRKNIDPIILIRFGVPSVIGAIIGAILLFYVNQLPINDPIHIGKIGLHLSPIKIIIGMLIILFGVLEFLEFEAQNKTIKSMTLGGLASGFFGGLSGHQGAIRSSFLLKYKLTKESFIATGVGIACLVDVTRIVVYLPQLARGFNRNQMIYLLIAVLSAIAGAWTGNKYLKKLQNKQIRLITTIGIVLIGLAMVLGLI